MRHAAVATHAPTSLRGSAFGLLAVTQTAGKLAASAFAGIVWTIVSPTAAFIFLAVTMTAATGTLAVSANRDSEAEHEFRHNAEIDIGVPPNAGSGTLEPATTWHPHGELSARGGLA